VQRLVAAWERFWFDRSMEPGRLAALRVAFFGLFGLDQLHLMIRHAWRYGAGGTRLAHFELLDALLPAPSADVQCLIYLICAFLSLRIAAGVQVRGSLAVLTVLYSWNYFGSALDGYQHHYLMCWLLLLSNVVPFHRAPGVDSPPHDGSRLKSWSFSLLYAQIAIVYLFTAITKVNAQWLDGWALEQQISNPWIRETMESMGAAVGVTGLGPYAAVSIGICLWQFTVAASFIMPKLRPWACITGPIFHAMVEVIGLEIEWFSYYMIALYYLLLFPDTWFEASGRWLARVAEPLRAVWARAKATTQLPLAADVIVAVICGGLVLAGPLPGTAIAAAAIAAVVLLARRAEGAWLRLGVQLGAAALVFAVPRWGGSAYDFYRFQGGDYTRRGEIGPAIDAYTAAVALGPDKGSRRVKLAGLLRQEGRLDESLKLYLEAQRLDPEDKRAARGADEVAAALVAKKAPQGPPKIR